MRVTALRTLKHNSYNVVGLLAICFFLANSLQLAIIHFELYRGGATRGSRATSSA